MLARSNATPAKIPSSHIIKRAWPSACATTASMLCGTAIANPGFTLVSADCTNFVTVSTLRLLRTAMLTNGKFSCVHARRFRHSNRAHISDDSDDLARHSKACHQECFADWIFIWENLLRPDLTNQTDLLCVGRVVLIELTSSQKGNTPGLEIIGRDVVAWRAGAFLHGRNIAVRAHIKRSITSIQRNIAADCRALETVNIAQLIKYLFCKTLTRLSIGILRDRQCNCARPKILGMEAYVLLTQPDETRDEQRRAGQQRDRERDLRAYEDFAETLLVHTAARAAAALFQAAH